MFSIKKEKEFIKQIVTQYNTSEIA